MLVNKDFLTWFLICWRLCWFEKSLLTNMDFNLFLSNLGPRSRENGSKHLDKMSHMEEGQSAISWTREL